MSKKRKHSDPISPERSQPKNLNPAIRYPSGQDVALNLTHLRVERQQSFHQGPLPPSSELEAYRRLYPDSAKILFENFDAQSRHRRAMEEFTLKTEAYERDKAFNFEAQEIRRGQYLAFGSILLYMLIACMAIYFHQPWVAGILGAIGLSQIVTTFIAGRDKRKQASEALGSSKQDPENQTPTTPPQINNDKHSTA